ncbi:RES domain-containing protein [Curtobacterium flaccumfaciens]|uniref:RES domain-containing protein n=1 Tax=Curtobacterium flaccumfaciens TaxID=2035 RepID=UPI0039924351
MIAHNDVRPVAVEVVAIDVEASGIVDLRDVSALKAVGIDLEDALAPWQTIAEGGGTPRSWTVRDRLIEVGADGLIDPSRKSLGLWHLVLFRWNVADAPSARLLDTHRLGE